MPSDAYNQIVKATDHTTLITDSVLQGIFKRALQGAFGEFEFTVKGSPYAATDTTIRLQLTDTANLLINTNNLSQTRFTVEYVDNRTPGSEFRFLWIQKQATDAGDGSVSIALDSSPDFAYRSIVIGGGVGQFSFSDDAVTTQIANTAGTTLDAGFRIFRNDNVAVTSAAVLNTISLRNATYRWILSGSGTTEYYVELAAGGDPGLDEPDSVLGNALTFTAGTIGSLAASEWVFGNNDTLGFTTVYVRLADGTDPDASAVNFVTAVIPVIVLPRWVNPLIAPHNAVGDGTNDDRTELLAADTAAGINGSTYIEAGKTYHIAAEAANPTFVSDFIFDNGGLVDVNSGTTVTFDGPITAGVHQKLFTGAGTVALGSKVTNVSPKWFGAVGDGVADDSAAILAAHTAMATAGGILRFPAGTYLISSNTAIGSTTIGVEMDAGAVVSRASGVTLTINGPFIADRSQKFSGLGTTKFNDDAITDTVMAEWFGTAQNTSYDAARATANVTAFTNANASFTGNGGTISWGYGTFFIDDSLASALDWLRIIGQGQKTILKAGTGMTNPMIDIGTAASSTNWASVEKIRLDGNDETLIGIRFGSVNHIGAITDVFVTKCATTGVSLNRFSGTTREPEVNNLTNLDCVSCGTGLLLDTNATTTNVYGGRYVLNTVGIKVINGVNINIHGSQIEQNTSYGIQLDGTRGTSLHGVEFEQNHSTGAGPQLFIGNIEGTGDCEGIAVLGGYFQGASPVSQTAIELEDCQEVFLFGFHTEGHQTQGILVGAQAENVFICADTTDEGTPVTNNGTNVINLLPSVLDFGNLSIANLGALTTPSVTVNDASNPNILIGATAASGKVRLLAEGSQDQDFVVDMDPDGNIGGENMDIRVNGVTEYSFSATLLDAQSNDITTTGNIGIKTSTFGNDAIGVFGLSNVGAGVPTSSPVNMVQLYAQDVATKSELKVRDEDGNITTLSPHDVETGEWVFYSENPRTGRRLKVDMEKLVKFIDERFDTEFVTEEDIIKTK